MNATIKRKIKEATPEELNDWLKDIDEKEKAHLSEMSDYFETRRLIRMELRRRNVMIL